MNIHKSLRYLLVGSLALTNLVSYSNNLVSYSNDNRANGIDYHKQNEILKEQNKTLQAEKAKLEEELEAVKQSNPGINIQKPSFVTKLLHVATLSLVGGAFEAVVQSSPEDSFFKSLISLSKQAAYFSPYWALGATAVAFDVPKLLTPTRFTGHIVNTNLPNFVVFLGSRALTSKVIVPYCSKLISPLTKYLDGFKSQSDGV